MDTRNTVDYVADIYDQSKIRNWLSIEYNVNNICT